MQCNYCKAKMSKGWDYCPNCGSLLIRDDFSWHFKRMDDMIKNIEKEFQRDFEIFDIKPLLKNPKSKTSGFSFSIEQKNNEKPRIRIKTFGDIKKEDAENQVKKFLNTEKQKIVKPKEKVKIEKMEEPETSLRAIPGKVVVEMNLPDVKEESVKIKELQESIEVFATAKDKGYFKIITIPRGSGIINKEFDKGKLRLEIG